MIFFRLAALVFCFLGMAYGEEKPPVLLVSIAAYQDIVQEMIGDTADVHCVVPSGASFHTFEPTPAQVLMLSRAKIWFLIDAPFEKRIITALQSSGKSPSTVDLQTGLQLLHDPKCPDCLGRTDTHIWTSPRMMKLQFGTIKEALVTAFPVQKESIEARYAVLVHRIDELISYTDAKLSGNAGKIIVIAHGAYDYLCHDYGVEQCPVEVGGKETTAKTLHGLIQDAKERNVKTVFSVKQYPKKGIERVADALGAKVIELDAYQPDYFAGMRTTADMFSIALLEER